MYVVCMHTYVHTYIRAYVHKSSCLPPTCIYVEIENFDNRMQSANEPFADYLAALHKLANFPTFLLRFYDKFFVACRISVQKNACWLALILSELTLEVAKREILAAKNERGHLQQLSASVSTQSVKSTFHVYSKTKGGGTYGNYHQRNSVPVGAKPCTYCGYEKHHICTSTK
jgi:hypothetical protein